MIKRFHTLLRVRVFSKLGDRLLATEARLTSKYGGEESEECRVWILRLRDLLRCRYVGFKEVVIRIHRIKLAAFLLMGEDVIRLLDAFEKRIVIGITNSAGFFVRVVFQYLFAIWTNRMT